MKTWTQEELNVLTPEQFEALSSEEQQEVKSQAKTLFLARHPDLIQ